MNARARIEAEAHRLPAENDAPPVAATTEGASNAVEAIARAAYYRNGRAGNRSITAQKRPVRTAGQWKRPPCRIYAFRASTGQIWAFEGKKGRVLAMLATMPQGVTQWDCWPWHTRLGSSIHAMRRDGLQIDTVREGEFRHARYTLATPGALAGLGAMDAGAVSNDRAEP